MRGVVAVGLTYPQRFTQCITNSRNAMYLLGILYNNTLGIALSITETLTIL